MRFKPCLITSLSRDYLLKVHNRILNVVSSYSTE
nr:MAG TPA: hypothetical protein [Caudoviricetes sp.]